MGNWSDKVLEISPHAAETIKEMVALERAPDSAGLRISASPLTSNGHGPELVLELATEPSEGDQVVVEEGAHVFLGQAAATMLEDKLLDVRLAPHGQPRFALREQ
jgi:iron-sulfur cluster assembly protein